METLAPILVAIGLVLVLFGAISALGARAGIGRMPGDIRARRGPVRFYAPLGSSLILSVLLTIVLNAALCGAIR